MEKLFIVLLWSIAISSYLGRVITAQSFAHNEDGPLNTEGTAGFTAARYETTRSPCIKDNLAERECFTNQNIMYPSYNYEDPLGIIELLSGQLEVICSRFNDYRSALECAYNLTWSCLDEETRDHTMPRPSFVSSMMHRLCNNKQYINRGCALSVYPKIFQCVLNEIPDGTGFPDEFCSYRQLGTECMAKEMGVCGCNTALVLTQIHGVDSRPPACEPLTFVPTCSADALASDPRRGVVLAAAALVLRLISAPSYV